MALRTFVCEKCGTEIIIASASNKSFKEIKADLNAKIIKI